MVPKTITLYTYRSTTSSSSSSSSSFCSLNVSLLKQSVVNAFVSSFCFHSMLFSHGEIQQNACCHSIWRAISLVYVCTVYINESVCVCVWMIFLFLYTHGFFTTRIKYNVVEAVIRYHLAMEMIKSQKHARNHKTLNAIWCVMSNAMTRRGDSSSSISSNDNKQKLYE